MLELFRDTYRYRELIWILAVKELKVRYKRSVLGFFWALLHPLLMMVVLTVVFSSILRFGIEKYPVFLVSGLFPWIFFSQSLLYASESIVTNGPLIKKVYVPKLVFPLAAILANLINFLLSLLPMALILLLLGFPFHTTWVFLPIPLLGLVLFAVGCGFIVSTINVFFHDMHHILQILLTAYFYFCPVIYDLSVVEARFHGLFRWNPLLYVLGGFRSAIYYGDPLPAPAVAVALGGGLLMVAVGYALFRRYQDTFPLYV
ncbi:MAG: ABC transporter permease [Acidobacteria bacterium]|nr:ABC transporter permease [Acidobacteriota bacterium]